MTLTLLALDLGGIVGFAVGALDADRPRSGAWQLPKHGSLGAKFCAYENELIDALDLFKPARVVMEAPMAMPALAQHSEIAAHHQIGLAAYTHGECYRRSIPLYSRPVSTVRKTVLGTGRFKAGEAKPAVLAWCSRVGWATPDHNAADAMVLWEYERGQIRLLRRVAA